ncbi:protein phosphatase 2C domain-containing protein [Candidatus Gottesmanbacteria bacterium]|nr:protein phosphatase 2C domain-containing protein [Candidatus Gottesmanbacteria bacterium]
MKVVDPLTLRAARPKQGIIFAASQLVGTRERQEDYFINFNDECFVVADGLGGLPHGEVAAKFAAETAVWGYKLIRQRRVYWLDKKLLLQRIFRSTNIALWQKRRETGFTEGMGTTLEVLLVGERNFWLGHVGDSSAWFLHKGKFAKLTHDDTDSDGHLTKVIGGMRYGLTPQCVCGRFVPGDAILLLTDGVTNYMPSPKIFKIIEKAGTSSEGLTESIIGLFKEAEAGGSTDNMTACIVKRVATT